MEPSKEDWNKGKYLQPDLYDKSEEYKMVKPLDTPSQKPLDIKSTDARD